MFDFGFDSNRKIPLDDFVQFSLRISGMRASVEYIIEKHEDSCLLSYYSHLYNGNERIRKLEEETSLTQEEVQEAFSRFSISKWDGFHGKHPRAVKDGEQFELVITNDGEKAIRADGSANFPRGYRELRQWLDDKLR